jgi:hypothetical protein
MTVSLETTGFAAFATSENESGAGVISARFTTRKRATGVDVRHWCRRQDGALEQTANGIFVPARDLARFADLALSALSQARVSGLLESSS